MPQFHEKGTWELCCLPPPRDPALSTSYLVLLSLSFKRKLIMNTALLVCSVSFSSELLNPKGMLGALNL